jgi:hypothetical protein
VKRITLALLFSCLVFSSASGAPMAEARLFHHLDGSDTLVGTIRAVSRNSFDIYDEYDKTVKRFVYLDPSSAYRPGDRVRIYYDRGSNVVRIIKKMTDLGAPKNGQNLGYIMQNQK